MSKAIQQIEILSKQLAALLPMKPEDKQRLDKKFRLEFSYNSNHLEGNTLTYHETELLLIFGETKGGHSKQELDEMEAHDVAFRMIMDWAEDKERPLTESDIRTLNEVILVKPFWKDAITPDGQNVRRQIKIGVYKEHPNSVRLQNGEMFHYASPAETPMKMGDLMQWYREEEEKKDLHPVELAALFHYKFVCIHPFDDGNGRISRLLMNYVLLKHGLPPVVIKSADKKNYLRALNEADAGDLSAFVDYVMEQLLWSLDIYLKAAKGESIDEPGDLERKLSLLKKKIGQSNDAKIEIRYGGGAVKFVVEQIIIPLANLWEEKLIEFDPLFYSRFSVIYSPDNGRKGTSINTTLRLFYEDYLLKRLAEPNPIDEIKLAITFQKLRAIPNDNAGYNGGEIRFIFHPNAYEIEYIGSAKTMSKLYHQSLSDDEIFEIVSTVGNWFFSNIEKAIENNKV